MSTIVLVVLWVMTSADDDYASHELYLKFYTIFQWFLILSIRCEYADIEGQWVMKSSE